MAQNVKTESTLTDRYQTTVPEVVRKALHLRKRDKLHYNVQANGSVLLSRAIKPGDEDPVLGQFLKFLAHDMSAHPERIRPVSKALMQRMQSLTQGVKFDMNAPLSADDE
jgi:antitoxin PrlF